MAIALVMALPFSTKAEENLNQVPPDPTDQGWVEVRSSDAAFKPYLKRRLPTGWLLGFGMEAYKPDGFTSPIDGLTYEDIFGDGYMEMMFLEGGYKMNLGAVSLGLVGNYAVTSPSGYANGESRDYKIERKEIKAMAIFDGIIEEPYLAPYVSFGLFQIGMDEHVPSAAFQFSGETQMGTSLTVGVLVQTNWLEPDAARWAWLNAGVENTYIDLYLKQHGTTGGENDPDVSSKFNWGAGLRIEF